MSDTKVDGNQPASRADIAAAAEQIVQAVEEVADHPRYHSGWSRRTCGECGHFDRYAGEARGECYAHPPGVRTNSSPQERPVVRDGCRACGEFTLESAPTVRGKRNPETPGHAAQAARAERPTRKE